LFNDPFYFEQKISNKLFYEKIQELRKEILFNENLINSFLTIFATKKSSRIYFDFPRLRAITTYGHFLDEARPAYYFHRDTWYGNSPSQWNIWVPLCEINQKNSFGFAPDYFFKEIKNNSELFKLESWNRKGGFQSLNSDANIDKVFPRNLMEIPCDKIHRFNLNENEGIIFSAHHLHGTLPNYSDSTRFSLEFRIVFESDLLTGNSAPEVDNKSKGSFLKEFNSKFI
ncbi:MAG: hypothetical protein KDK36_00965, partial [Leptospiraceae bacterium]|nr:hypothetical protein [Leptospiraceae bacterium]